jgi:hypothetical protein
LSPNSVEFFRLQPAHSGSLRCGNSANAGIEVTPSRWATSQSAAGNRVGANSTSAEIGMEVLRQASGDAAHAVGQGPRAWADGQRMRLSVAHSPGDLDEFAQAPVMSRFLSRGFEPIARQEGRCAWSRGTCQARRCPESP